MPRPKLLQRPRIRKKPGSVHPETHREGTEFQGLRNQEICELLGMTSGNVARAARQGKLLRHDDGSYTRESVVDYARRQQGKLEFTLPGEEPLNGELVPTNGHVLSGEMDLGMLEVLYMRARIRDQESAAALRELALARETGAVLDRIQTEHTVQAAFGAVCQALQNLPARLTPELTGLDDEDEVYRRLDGEVRRVIRGLQQAIQEIG